jgi:hypothetical protein
MAWWLDHGEGVGKGPTPEAARENLAGIEEPLQMARNPGDGRSQLIRAPWAGAGSSL